VNSNAKWPEFSCFLSCTDSFVASRQPERTRAAAGRPVARSFSKRAVDELRWLRPLAKAARYDEIMKTWADPNGANLSHLKRAKMGTL